LLNIFILATPD